MNFDSIPSKPAGEALRLKPQRIGIVDVYGGSMPSGWVQWICGQYGFHYQVVYPPTLDAGNLAARYDVLILEDGILRGGGQTRESSGPNPETIPAEHRNKLGTITEAKTIPQLRQFLADGGTILAIGSSSGLGQALGLPVANALVDEKTGRAAFGGELLYSGRNPPGARGHRPSARLRLAGKARHLLQQQSRLIG